MWFLTVLTISLRERHITVIRPLGTIHIYLHQSNFAHFFLKKNISELECYLFLELTKPTSCNTAIIWPEQPYAWVIGHLPPWTLVP